jgi:hypothetical protein
VNVCVFLPPYFCSNFHRRNASKTWGIPQAFHRLYWNMLVVLKLFWSHWFCGFWFWCEISLYLWRVHANSGCEHGAAVLLDKVDARLVTWSRFTYLLAMVLPHPFLFAVSHTLGLDCSGSKPQSFGSVLGWHIWTKKLLSATHHIADVCLRCCW